MEPAGSPISVFSFLNAVRTHKPIEDVEKCRQSLQTETGENAYSFSDGLKYAIMYGHLKYSEYLLKFHLEESLAETVCCPLLLLAVRLDKPEAVEQLCKYSRLKKKHNFYVDKPGCSDMESGRTALHIATETGNLACTRVLLQYGANFSAKDDFGQNAMDRILDRLKSPHINSRTILCLLELFKCQPSITAYEILAFQRIVDNCLTNLRSNMDSYWYDMQPGPFSLKQICRCKIRSMMMYPRLPEKLSELGLPQQLVNYLDIYKCKLFGIECQSC